METNLNGSATKIRIDVGAVGLAFGNLLDNAMKYSPKDRRIHVEIIENDDMVGVEVRDHGIGIPPEETQRIFEAFYRAKETAGTGGYGLGLYMVEEIMRVHGGRVVVESRQGSGSGFKLVFPLGDPA